MKGQQIDSDGERCLSLIAKRISGYQQCKRKAESHYHPHLWVTPGAPLRGFRRSLHSLSSITLSLVLRWVREMPLKHKKVTHRA